jgi:hypothetical protein
MSTCMSKDTLVLFSLPCFTFKVSIASLNCFPMLDFIMFLVIYLSYWVCFSYTFTFLIILLVMESIFTFFRRSSKFNVVSDWNVSSHKMSTPYGATSIMTTCFPFASLSCYFLFFRVSFTRVPPSMSKFGTNGII